MKLIKTSINMEIIKACREVQELPNVQLIERDNKFIVVIVVS